MRANTTRNNTSYSRKDGDENGARIYQLMLNSMQLLPITDIVQITEPNPVEKRGPPDDSPDDSLPKTHKKQNTKNMNTPKKNMPIRGSVRGSNTSKSSSKPIDVPMDI